MQSLPPSPQKAATELLQRRRARTDLIAFTEYTAPGYAAAAHHRQIAEKLEAVAAGRVTRLMITMPPRHGKSELASRRFPAWLMGARAGLDVIAASYNADLAADFGREVRNIVASKEFSTLFDVSLAKDSQAANRWHTDDGGMYVAAGVGTAVTGRGADVFLIDDPFKDHAEADSESRRELVWNWYSSTVYTRLSAEGRIILIQTRWHEDDLAGRLLAEERRGADRWETIDLPAIDAQGRPLWPERYPLARLNQIERVILPRHWSALYQQRPAPEEGAFFKRAWFRSYDEVPKHLTFYGASDYAVTADGGDYTVHVVVGVDAGGNLYVVDLWRARTQSDVWVEQFLNLVETYDPFQWAEPADQIRKSLGPIIERRMEERGVYCVRKAYSEAKQDKPQKAQAFRARAAMGKVYLPAKAPWLNDLLSELLAFNAGTHDDQVDALGLIGRMLAEMHGDPPRQKRTAPPRSTYRRLGPTGESYRTV